MAKKKTKTTKKKAKTTKKKICKMSSQDMLQQVLEVSLHLIQVYLDIESKKNKNKCYKI